MQEDKLTTLKEKINESPTIEERVRLAIDFMKLALSSGNTPKFREFWEAKKLALELFKEKMNPLARGAFWKEYIDLTTEVKRLKEILDEQSAFSVEQIELAISAFESDLESYEEQLSKIDSVTVPEAAFTLKKRRDFYETAQQELAFLNIMATRLTALRKEVIKTDMRIRHKNKILQHLSTAGDRVFPRRKELIKEVSDHFIKDVRTFKERNFSGESTQSKGPPIYQLRDEIKAFQEMAKVLTLNTQSFQESRKILSSCWEALREAGKKRKEELESKREIEEVERKDQKEAIEKAREKSKKREDELDEAFKKWNTLFDETLSLNELKDMLEVLRKERESLKLSHSESRRFEDFERKAVDHLLDIEEDELLACDQVNEEFLERLENAVEKREIQRAQTKELLENLRKEEGSSGLDFERAMACREKVEYARHRLQHIDRAIETLQAKIDEITE